MHAAIIADAFRVPWIPLALSPDFSYFKWNDWAKSLEVDIKIINGMSGYKRGLRIFQSFKKIITGRGRPMIANEDPNSEIRSPNLDMPEVDPDIILMHIGRDRIRKVIKSLAPLVERSISSDLKMAQLEKPHLSDDTILSSRQDQIQERIFQIQNGRNISL
jgi:succinoglycan biosynthesis protein ExoV